MPAMVNVNELPKNSPLEVFQQNILDVKGLQRSAHDL